MAIRSSISQCSSLVARGTGRPAVQNELLDQDRKEFLPQDDEGEFITVDKREVGWVEFSQEDDENGHLDVSSLTSEFKPLICPNAGRGGGIDLSVV
jgi:hypothetical protein